MFEWIYGGFSQVLNFFKEFAASCQKTFCRGMLADVEHGALAGLRGSLVHDSYLAYFMYLIGAKLCSLTRNHRFCTFQR
jgi:hypothetical protein